MTWLTQGPSEVPKTTLRFLDPRLRKAALLAATVHHSEGLHIDTAQETRPGRSPSGRAPPPVTEVALSPHSRGTRRHV